MEWSIRAEEMLAIYERLRHKDVVEVREMVERLKRMSATDENRINE